MLTCPAHPSPTGSPRMAFLGCQVMHTPSQLVSQSAPDICCHWETKTRPKRVKPPQPRPVLAHMADWPALCCSKDPLVCHTTAPLCASHPDPRSSDSHKLMRTSLSQLQAANTKTSDPEGLQQLSSSVPWCQHYSLPFSQATKPQRTLQHSRDGPLTKAVTS